MKASLQKSADYNPDRDQCYLCERLLSEHKPRELQACNLILENKLFKLSIQYYEARMEYEETRKK